MNLKITFGKNVKYYRFQRKYTQETLAEKVDISTTYLSEIERGLHSVDFDIIKALSLALAIEPFQLFADPSNKKLPRRIDMLLKNNE